MANVPGRPFRRDPPLEGGSKTTELESKNSLVGWSNLGLPISQKSSILIYLWTVFGVFMILWEDHFIDINSEKRCFMTILDAKKGQKRNFEVVSRWILVKIIENL